MLLFQEYCDLVNWLHLHFCKDVVRGVINLILTSNQTFSIVEMLRKFEHYIGECPQLLKKTKEYY